jgi:hypothetical protein
MLGLSSWPPVVSGVAGLLALLLVELSYARPAPRLRAAAGVLAAVAVASLLAAALDC